MHPGDRLAASLVGLRHIGRILLALVPGGAEFSVGESVQQLDAVICCTGYNYHFPFLDLKVRVVERLAAAMLRRACAGANT
jgi:hypothetical protein